MARFTPFRGKLALENADFNRKVDQSGRHVQKFAKDTQQSLSGSSKSAKEFSVEIAAMGASAVGSITLVVNKLKELEADLLLVQYAWTDMGQAGRDAVRMIAQEQAKLTGSAVSDVVKVQTALSNQGIDPRSASGQALTNVVANFADATGKSHAGVIDSLSPGSIATGASHQRLLDVFAAVGQRTRGGLQGGFDLLGQFLPALAPTGSALGLDESELSALLGTASWHTPRARRAGSGIRMVLEEAVKPDSKFAKAFADTFEMSLEEAVGGRGLTGLIEAFERAMTAWGDKGFIGSFGSAETGSLAAAVVGDQRRLQQMLQAAQQSAGAAQRINEQYEGTLKQTAGVLAATFESGQLTLGKLFEEDAVDWMNTLQSILGDKDILEAAGMFLDSARLLSEPLREVAKPLADFAAAIMQQLGRDVIGQASPLDMIIGAMAIRGSVAGVKRVVKPSSLKTSGLGAGMLSGLRAAKGPATATGRVLSGAAHAGFGGIYGYGLLQQMLADPETAEAALREAAGMDVRRMAEFAAMNTGIVRNIFGDDDYAAAMQPLGMLHRDTNLQGERYTLSQQANIMRHMLDNLEARDIAKLIEKSGVSSSLPEILGQYTELSFDEIQEANEKYAQNQELLADMAAFTTYEFSEMARAAGMAADALGDIEPPPPAPSRTGMGMYQAAQLGMAQLAPAGFSPRDALRFAGGVGRHSPMSYMQQQAAADKIAAAFRSDGILSNQERGILAAIDLHLSELKGLQRRTADSNEEIEQNTAPQRDYRAQIDIIESADRLLVGG